MRQSRRPNCGRFRDPHRPPAAVEQRPSQQYPWHARPYYCRRRYGDRGYVFGYIVGFDGMDSGQIVAQVVEGKVKPVCALHLTHFLTHIKFLPATQPWLAIWMWSCLAT